jgi:hypothetical protein
MGLLSYGFCAVLLLFRNNKEKLSKCAGVLQVIKSDLQRAAALPVQSQSNGEDTVSVQWNFLKKVGMTV